MSITDTDWKSLEVEQQGPVLRVWLNRPERLNAISPVMLMEIGDLFSALERDFDTRVVVLGGRGRCFSAGADRKGPEPEQQIPSPRSDRERRWLDQVGRRACQAIEDCDVVTVARVHSHAVGGGCCFAMACDFRIGSEDASLLVPEVDLGIPLTWGATSRLIHEIGAAHAREVLMMCERIPSAKALAWGMLHEVVSAEELDAAVDGWTEKLVSKPELAIYMTKTQLRGYARRDALGDASETDGDMLQRAMTSNDAAGRFSLPKK
ncbi:MAG: enoyl-CoA hydratase/isomerase family protein [Myxococcota bacterium]|jgi:enoyl-CoA hydratase/carnithine racemase|nr:enoyl-CoA hydratase/isomerase family protein [Myxococcota bacterium]